jgi:hypothetical protein
MSQLVEFPDKKPQHVSYSRLALLASCGYKFGYKYLLGLPDYAGPAAELGGKIHEALDKGYKSGERNSRRIADLAHALVSEKSMHQSALHKGIDEIVPKLSLDKIWRDGMKAETTVMGERNGVKIKCIMDLVIETDDAIIIYDYKTNQKFNHKDHEFQGSLYAAVWKQVFKTEKPIAFVIHMLRTDKLYLIHTWKEEVLWNYFDHIMDMSKPELLRPNQKDCYKWGQPCSFSHKCPFYKGYK